MGLILNMQKEAKMNSNEAKGTRKVINRVSNAGLAKIGETVLQWASRQVFCTCGFVDIGLDEVQGCLKIRCMECGKQLEVVPCIEGG